MYFFSKYFHVRFTTFSLAYSLPHSHFACLFCCHIYDPIFLSLLQKSMVYFLEVRKRTGGSSGSAPSFLPAPQELVGSKPCELGIAVPRSQHTAPFSALSLSITLYKYT